MSALKVYDCSLNLFAPEHRSCSLGSKENDIMFDLKRYHSELSLNFIDNYKFADRIITNTTYTPEILQYAKEKSIPLIKRMDGVYWRTDLIDRNVKLNEAAIQSDSVIFISKFSQDSFRCLYPSSILKNQCVILNNVDETIFYEKSNHNDIFIWGTSATNWCRNEKRPKELLKFADFIDKYNEKILVIGKSELVHKNIINAGYHYDSLELSNIINRADAWVNFSYRDAAPKTVLQAIKCNKPVLYADSGGLSELVGDFGVSIKDNKDIVFSDDNYELDFNEVEKSYYKFKNNFKLFKPPVTMRYLDTLLEYANVIKM